MVGPRWPELAAAMGWSPVAMRGVLGQDGAEVAFAEDQHPVGDLGPNGEDEPFRIGVRARAPGRDLDGLDTGAGQDCGEGPGELPGRVADQEPEARSAISEIHQEIADLLCCPWPVRVRGDPGDVDMAAAGLDDEEAVQALERDRAVHVEEVGGEHRRGLHVQELPPGRIGVPPRRRGYLQVLEDPPDRRCANAVTELEQLALDPLVPPAVVLDSEPLDQRGHLGADWRSTRPVRIRPLPGDQAAVPPKNGAGRDQPVCPQPPRQEPDQRGEDRSVGPVQPGPRTGAAQHGDLVPQHEQLRVHGR